MKNKQKIQGAYKLQIKFTIHTVIAQYIIILQVKVFCQIRFMTFLRTRRCILRIRLCRTEYYECR